MNPNKKILIAGASIAGPALAYWLQRYGFEVTVVERAPAPRYGGQNIDVKGAGRQVAVKMGLEEAIKAANTGEVGVQFVNEDNEVEASFPKDNPNGLTSELEILRGDLVQILYNATKEAVRYQFGTHIVGLSEQAEAVRVTLADGRTEAYDLVVAADGLRSATRQLMFGDEPDIKFLGLYTCYLTIPRAGTDTDWARWYNAPDSRVLLLRPDNKGTTRASFNFLGDEDAYQHLSPDEQRQVLREKLAGAGWEAPRLLAALDDDPDLYFDAVSQVRAPRWTHGRYALLGDAGYCPSPITGMGTTLALVGAYVLAGELARHPEDHQQAFTAYEQRLRPFVEAAQELPPGTPALVYPSSRLGVAVLNKVAAVLASKPVAAISAWFNRPEREPDNNLQLPDYEHDAAYS
ncbi:FAD-binding monooxygenase [Hymenobacter gummosus]|uniref:FAD-binding monooxygenase n=1 Tax=Hymenobacter gummosus TaxID=1776032 RepID=A0A3S0JKV3_9BACT|nr:FAD-dependent monooxygenase [Hymenobacter gummosus]RTQ53587.1 FAD-binding monooxygenase [Hymenobacter gummosus]